MNHSFKIGFNFGATSGIITTMGLMVGLYSGTHSKTAVLGGILTIAIADACSDALGIHIAEESENRHTPREIWVSTFSTLVTKFIFASLFIIPVLIFDLTSAIRLNIALGILLLGILSFLIAREQGPNPWKVVIEHIMIALLVVIITHLAGLWISSTFQ